MDSPNGTFQFTRAASRLRCCGTSGSCPYSKAWPLRSGLEENGNATVNLSLISKDQIAAETTKLP